MTVDPSVKAYAKQFCSTSVANIRKEFCDVPFEIEHCEPYSQRLRIVLSSACDLSCSYPSREKMWCHNEGIVRYGSKPSRPSDLLPITAYFRNFHQIDKITIGGLQPSLTSATIKLINGLAEQEYSEITMTAHGKRLRPALHFLKDAGLTALTISIQNFDRKMFSQIMGWDGLSESKLAVDTALALGYSSIDLNRVLLRGATDDIPEYLDWIRSRNLTTRLYDLMWQPGHDDHFVRYAVSWMELADYWKPITERIVVRYFNTSMRTVVDFHLSGGGSIQVNLLEDKTKSRATVCRSCSYAEVCAEGYLGCGIRITPDLKASPCILRPELQYPLSELIGNRSKTESLLSGSILGGCQQGLDV